ncbi:TetR family transcriptional regulator [Mycobacterium kiyosense]|uniref:TetR family transcriptional regulator n=1 Tax=Mycobacterium kiyosense TaxID=2871094 RepID=UPI00222EEE38|nr:TetR family transcriptional regulator [Mycobacterium kiyosense]GLB93333.1 TetR family transcriptional regulator [Mycobacterium kiyosense]
MRQHQRARPGPKPRLNRDEIVSEALQILAVDGPDQLSLRRLAARLGVTARTLYGYFDSKESLESALVRRVMPVPPALDPAQPWHQQLRSYVLRIHDAFVEQPGAAQLFAARSARSSAMDQVREYLLTLLVDGGLSHADAIAALGTLSRYLMGCVVIEAQRHAEADVMAGRFAGLSPEMFPVLASFADEYDGRDSEESTRYGLDLILTGLRDVANRQAPSGRTNGALPARD